MIYENEIEEYEPTQEELRSEYLEGVILSYTNSKNEKRYAWAVDIGESIYIEAQTDWATRTAALSNFLKYEDKINAFKQD